MKMKFLFSLFTLSLITITKGKLSNQQQNELKALNQIGKEKSRALNTDEIPSTSSIQEHASFDIDKYIQALDDDECLAIQSNIAANKTQDFLKLTFCLSNLEHYLFGSITKTQGNPLKFFNNLDSLIYKPLANNMRKKTSFAELLMDLIVKYDDQELIDSH